MLAISFALALALHGDPFVQNTTVQSAPALGAAGAALSDITLIPYGHAFGTYDYAAGEMLALLEDASGVPLWVLDAEVYEHGGLDGDLLPLQYATNPVNPSVMLSVSGQVLLDEHGNGRFFATIFQFNGGAIPVFPVGKIEGVIQQPALGPTVPDISGLSGLVASTARATAYGPQVHGGVIVCPLAPGVTVQSAGALAQAGLAQQAGGLPPIVDPASASASGAGTAVGMGAGAKRERAAGHELVLAPGLARVQLRWWLE